MVIQILLRTPLTDISELIKNYSLIKLINCSPATSLSINNERFIKNQTFDIKMPTIIGKNNKSAVLMVVELL